MTHLALGMGNAQVDVSDATEQCGQCVRVPGHRLRRGLEVVHAAHCALQQDGHLEGQRHGDRAQAPSGRQPGSRHRVDEHGHDRLNDACNKRTAQLVTDK